MRKISEMRLSGMTDRWDRHNRESQVSQISLAQYNIKKRPKNYLFYCMID